MRNFLLYVHVLLAIVLLGPLFLGHFAMPPILRRGRDALPLARFFHTLEGRVAPATLLILVFGVLLVEDVGFSYADTWIWLAIVLVLVATALGGGLIGPAENRAIETIESGSDASGLILRIQVLGLVNVVNLAVILWLMIEKPGLG
ncbi:MAG: DUF2269 family protein [Actinomycetota bacterium]